MNRDELPTWLTNAAMEFGTSIGVPPSLGRGATMELTGLTDHKARLLLSHLRTLADLGVDPAPPPDRMFDVERYIDQDGYTFDEASDVYATAMRDGAVYRLPGEVHRAMKRAYSAWDGDPATLNAVCRHFGMRRKHFVEYKTRHGWTHDSSPFTNEELRDQPTDVLLGDLAKQREGSLERAWDQKKQSAIMASAARWDNLARGILAPLEERLEALRGTAPAVPHFSLPNRDEPPFAVVLGLTDQHHGKLGRIGDAYDRQVSRQRFEGATQETLRDVLRWGQPEQLIIPYGSDWTHIDTLLRTTTRGTPQDLDGLAEEVIEEAFDMFFSGVDLARQVSPRVRLLPMRGNHDRLIGWLLGIAAKLRYDSVDGVEVVLNPHPRNYALYGTTLLGFDHGDGRKLKDFESLVPYEAKRLWSQARSAIMFTGHLHHEETLDRQTKDLGRGIVVRQMPCLTGDDEYHVAKGHVGAWKALAAYVIRRETGIKDVIYTDVHGIAEEPPERAGMLAP